MTTKTTVQTYLRGWKQKDPAAIAGVLSDTVTFRGPMAQTEGREAFMAAVMGMFPMVKDIEPRGLFFDGDQAVAIYDFVCPEPIGLCRTAERLTIEGDKLVASEVFFDARPFEALARARAVSPAGAP